MPLFESEMNPKRNDELSRIAERRQGLNVSFLLSVGWVLALSSLMCSALERKVCAMGSIGLIEVGPMGLSRQSSKKANFSYQLREWFREWRLLWWIFRFLLIISMILGHDKRFLRASALRFMSSSFSMNFLKTLMPSDLWMLAPLTLGLALFMVLYFVC